MTLNYPYLKEELENEVYTTYQEAIANFHTECRRLVKLMEKSNDFDDISMMMEEYKEILEQEDILRKAFDNLYWDRAWITFFRLMGRDIKEMDCYFEKRDEAE